MFQDSFASCMSPSQRVLHVSQFEFMWCSGAQEFMSLTCSWSTRENKGVEYEHSAWGWASCWRSLLLHSRRLEDCMKRRGQALQKQGLRISQELEIVPGCAALVACPSCLENSPVSPGPGRGIRNMLGWSQLEKTVGSGVWLFRGALQGENLFSSLCAAGDWVKKGSYHTAWLVPCGSSCTCSYAYGHSPVFRPHTGERCWPLPAGV